mgnify:CR=1 FL=1
MNREKYFDHAATTPLNLHVREAMLPWLGDKWGNPSSIHCCGREAAAAVDTAREHIARLIEGASPEEIIFVSGATEAANAVLRSYDSVAASPFEHPAIRTLTIEKGGTIWPNKGYDLQPLSNSVILSAVMDINNETGAAIHLPNEPVICAQCLECLVDATQSLGKYLIRDRGWKYIIGSAHKLGGPMGIGMLYAKNGDFPKTLQRGGEQEHGYRAGTLNLPAIVGFGEAARLAYEERESRAHRSAHLRQIFLEEMAAVSDWHTNDHPTGFTSDYIVSINFKGIEGEALLIEADAAGFAISARSACSSHAHAPSHVLMALDPKAVLLGGTIRVSFSPDNTPESTQELAKVLIGAVERLRQNASLN